MMLTAKVMMRMRIFSEERVASGECRIALGFSQAEEHRVVAGIAHSEDAG